MGDPWGYRDGEWYREQLVRCELAERGGAAFRSGGTYLIVGGAGGVGAAFSEYLIREYQAQVVWIGRRAADGAIRREMERLAAYGPAPEYVCADASSYSALHSAYRQVRERHPVIHGVVHSAIVLLDRSIANMDEERFVAALSAKVNVSVNLARVFEGEKLDFMLFFSSLMSFVKAAGQSNYAAGSTFEDAFAKRLARGWACQVRTMNWGYWGDQGIVSSAQYRARLASQGYGSIEPTGAMAALECLVDGSIEQMGFLRVATGKRALGHLSIAGQMAQLPPAASSVDWRFLEGIAVPEAVLSNEGRAGRVLAGPV
jgi:NAD(P)-dependent dehydrogenase (short-subunit alcohol dehydrogenase family)